MLRRILATVLWAYFGWYLASHLAAFAGIPAAFAVLGAFAMAAIASIDLAPLRHQPAGTAETQPS